ncbi:hypothetical protein AAEH85_22575, partial [Shewanella algae]|uniref:hypothetical protein n=1 Tax=Shewanella algae TaxID=38313 RepID=UPI00313EE2E9
YQRHARWTDEREVLKAISSEMPTAELTPTAHSRLVTGADALKDKKMAVDELESFHSICKPKSKFVAAHPELQPTCV